MTSAQPLSLTTCQAPNADASVAAVAAYLTGQLGQPVNFVNDVDWHTRDQRLDAGQIDLGWICGWPYVRKMRRRPLTLALLAAPVPAGARYGGRPIYFSDVVVRRDSPYQTFADLRGAAWGYNEPGSHSGFNVVAYHLARQGLTWEFFGRVTATGAHEHSLRELLAGRLQASAIDSTVLETELKRQPALQAQLRVIDVLGPSPIPPWVAQTHLPADLRATLRRLLLDMHQTPEGRAALAVGDLARFAAVSDADYDAIRAMEKVAESIGLPN